MTLPETVPEACQFVSKLIPSLAREIGNTIIGEVHLETDDNWSCDSVVNVMVPFPNGGLWDTGYSITPVIEQEARVIGGEQHDVMYYYVQHEVMVHGTRYYPDGSGEPDTSDIVADHKTRSPHDAVKRAILLHLEHTIDQKLEADAEADMIVESDRWAEDNGDNERIISKNHLTFDKRYGRVLV